MNTQNKAFRVLFVFVFLISCSTRDVFVDPESKGGACSNSQNGEISQPVCTIIAGIKLATAGDIIQLRGGNHFTYLHDPPIPIGLSIFNTSGTTIDNPITIRGYENDETPIVSCLRYDSTWLLVSGEVYEAALDPTTLTYRVPHASQNDVPLRLVTPFGDDCTSSQIQERGEWCRNGAAHKIYIRSHDGGDPNSHKTGFCEFIKGGGNVFDIVGIIGDSSIRPENVVLENLIVEGGYYPIEIKANGFIINNVEIRNNYGDAIKLLPGATKGVISNCNIHTFGEQGIDMTGSSLMKVINNRIHDSVNIRGDLPPTFSKVNGIMVKYDAKDILLEKNYIYNLRYSVFGGFTLGGSSDTVFLHEATRLTVKGNIMYNCLDYRYFLTFMACKDCFFINNLIVNNEAENYGNIDISVNRDGYPNYNCTTLNNIFLSNELNGRFHVYENDNCDPSEFIFDHNLIPNIDSYVGGESLTMEEIRNNFGWEVNSQFVGMGESNGNRIRFSNQHSISY